VLKLNIETVEESVSTIEAEQIYIQNGNKKKDYKKLIDSVAAAVILRRIIV
jgi:RNase H-fold protein (predicted Holliday junction resolvase)